MPTPTLDNIESEPSTIYQLVGLDLFNSSSILCYLSTSWISYIHLLFSYWPLTNMTHWSIYSTDVSRIILTSDIAHTHRCMLPSFGLTSAYHQPPAHYLHSLLDWLEIKPRWLPTCMCCDCDVHWYRLWIHLHDYSKLVITYLLSISPLSTIYHLHKRGPATYLWSSFCLKSRCLPAFIPWKNSRITIIMDVIH